MKILRFLILFISFGFLGNKAQAQSGVSVSPPRTYFSLNPGEEDRKKILVTNVSETNTL